MDKSKKTPIEILKEKLYDIRFSEEKQRNSLDLNDLTEKAKSARKSFQNEYLSQTEPSY